MGFLEAMRTFAARIGNGLLNMSAAAAVTLDALYRMLDALYIVSSKYAWPLTPSLSPILLLSLAAAIRKEPAASQHTIYRSIRDQLRLDNWQELRLLVDQMSNYSIMAGMRHKILRDTVTAITLHGQNGFNAANLIIPTIFTQIDGILGDFALEVGVKKWGDRKNHGPEKLRAEFEKVTYSFDKPALDVIFDVLFSESYDDSGRRLNRHRVLHGQWLLYGRIEHVLRAILIVDFLGYVIEEYRERAAAGDFEDPITENSKLSKLYSENLVSPITQFALQRLGIPPERLDAFVHEAGRQQ